MKRYWDSRRRQRYSAALLLAIIISCTAVYYADRDRSSLLYAGDFPGFYAPAVIAWNGQWQQLYDEKLQQEIENEGWPFFKSEFYMSVYPAYLALLLKPLGALPPLTARHVFQIASVLAFAAALWVLSTTSLLTRAAALLLFSPVFFGVLGGQNTAFSMLLAGLAVHFARRKRPVLLGLCAGLWLVKPQFGLLLVVYLLLAGQFRAVAAAGVVGLLFFLWAGIEAGFDWPVRWIQGLAAFSPRNYVANQGAQVSLAGAAQAALNLFNPAAGVRGLILAMVAAVSAAVFLWPVHFYYRTRDLARSLLLFGIVLPAVSPQTLFYDLGIAAFCLSDFAGWESDRRVWYLAAGIIGAAGLAVLRDVFPYATLFPLTVVMLLAAAQELREPGT